MSTRPRTPAQTLRQNTVALLAFWLALGALLWWGFSWWDSRQRAALQPYPASGGALVIPRSADGHFYVDGEVNHVPVRFMVDTGASNVAVSDRVARSARLPEGSPVTVSTANGEREGRLVRNVPVRAASLARNDITVISGLNLADDGSGALLGQSFLRHYDVRIEGSRMLLQPR